MALDDIFRLTFGLTFVMAITISASFRARARRAGGAIPRSREGKPFMALRLLFAAPLFLAIAAYILNPEWLAWSALGLPAWLRALGGVIALASIPVLVWIFLSLGKNISETVLTKDEHALVTHGPYRWVRHPLYAVASTIFIGLGVVSESGVLLFAALVAFGAIAIWVVPREEANLVSKFGEAYQTYRRQTGMLVPRIFARKPRVSLSSR